MLPAAAWAARRRMGGRISSSIRPESGSLVPGRRSRTKPERSLNTLRGNAVTSVARARGDARPSSDGVGEVDLLPPLGGDRLPLFPRLSYEAGRDRPGEMSPLPLLRPKKPPLPFLFLASSRMDIGTEFHIGSSSEVKGMYRSACRACVNGAMRSLRGIEWTMLNMG